MLGDTRGVDEILNSYFARREGDLSYQLLQEDQDQALLLAILMELRELNGDTSPGAGNPGSQTADYITQSVTVDADWSKYDLGWPINDLLLLNFTEPIEVALADPDRGQHTIPLETADEPTTFSPNNGLATTEVWYRLQDDASGPTGLTLAGFA